MTANCILKQFELVTNTPGNISLLRRFVIDLAVRGKLIEKSSKDESAAEIIRRIAAKKELLTKDGKIKKQKPLRPIAEGDVPAVYSAHCVFERLANIAMLDKGLTGIQSAQPGQYPLVVTAGVRSSCDHFDFEGAAAIIPMVSSTGHGHASLNRLHYQEGKFALGNILCAVFPISDDLISARFLYEYLTAFKEELLVSKMIGTANVSLTIGKIGEVPVPIVSKTVQRRVYELMALCDRLEAAQVERESRRDRLVASSLNRLNNGADPDAFRDHARFHFNHLPRLTTRLVHIQQLRQTILNLAVRGKLVPQDPKDESVPELLKRIQAEKMQLVKAGEAKEQRQYCEDADIDKPFNIPKTWRWVSLGEIAFGFRYGTSVKCSYERIGQPVLRIPNVDNGRINVEGLKFGSLSAREAKDLQLQLGDILMVRSNGSLNLVGRPALVESHAVGFCYAGYLVRVRTSVFHLNSRYLLLALNTTHVRDQIEIPIRTAVGLKNVNATELGSLSIPLPPLAEQQRIVAKVEELMALCDRLEAQIATTQNESCRLLEAVLHEVLAGAAGETML